MANQKLSIAIFGALLLITGTIGPLVNKLEDTTDVTPGTVTGPDRLTFLHPLFQTACMFLGEMLWLITMRNPKTSFSIAKKMLVPASCDLVATVMQNLAIAYTFPSHIGVLSSFQVITTALFSVLFFRRFLSKMQWWGLCLVVAGSFLMIVPSALSQNQYARNALLGDLLMIAAQFFRPLQYIFEERAVSGVENVMECVGWEGVWGFALCICMIPLFYVLPGPTAQHLDNLFASIHQLNNSKLLQMTTAVFMVNVAFYNFCGLTVTQKASCTVRAVINAFRTVTIWILSMALHWETFTYTPIFGFVFILSGTLLYNFFSDESAQTVDDLEDDEDIQPLLRKASKFI